MTTKSILCRLGLHRWKWVYRYGQWIITTPAFREFDFTGWCPQRSEVCTRCGKRRAV